MSHRENLILAAETSTPWGSVAVLRQPQNGGTELLGERFWDRQQSHSEIIALETRDLLKQLNVSFEDISLYACGTGPGSFTGIRVALNFIKSLAYSFQKPVLVMNSLKLLALPALQKYPEIFCAQSAFRDLVYVAQYERTPAGIKEVLAPSAWTFAQLQQDLTAPMPIVGGALGDSKSSLLPDLSLEPRPRARSFMLHDFADSQNSEILQWFQVKALYVRASEAEEKLWKGGPSQSDRQSDEVS